MAPHSSTLAWKIPWMEGPGRLQSMGLRRVRHNWATSLSLFTFLHWRRKWQPTPVFFPGESQGRGSLVGCRPWGLTESDTTEATWQQQQQQQDLFYTWKWTLFDPLHPFLPTLHSLPLETSSLFSLNLGVRFCCSCLESPYTWAHMPCVFLLPIREVKQCHRAIGCQSSDVNPGS